MKYLFIIPMVFGAAYLMRDDLQIFWGVAILIWADNIAKHVK